VGLAAGKGARRPGCSTAAGGSTVLQIFVPPDNCMHALCQRSFGVIYHTLGLNKKFLCYLPHGGCDKYLEGGQNDKEDDPWAGLRGRGWAVDAPVAVERAAPSS